MKTLRRALIDTSVTLLVVVVVIFATCALLWATAAINDEVDEIKRIIEPVETY